MRPTLLIMIRLSIIVCFLLTTHSIAQEYVARVGDTITVTVRERDWLSGKVVVSPEGFVLLPEPVGSLRVAGLTLDQITELIRNQLKEYIVDPNVVVSISPDFSLKVHVTGEVRAPGSFTLLPGTSLQEVITRAGGFTPIADKTQIRILREATEFSEQIVDFTRFEEDADVYYNPQIQDEDVLVVPRLPKPNRSPTFTVMGAVNRPGTFPIDEPLSVIRAIAQAGGSTPHADLQRLRLIGIRDGQALWDQLNLEAFLTGEGAEDFGGLVYPDDTLFVPERPEEKLVEIEVNLMGQVVRPGAYIFNREARLFDAIARAGGYGDNAAIDKVVINRLSNPHPQRIEINTERYITTSDIEHNPILKTGDTVFVPIQDEPAKGIAAVQTIFFDSLSVTIIGEVRLPDTYRVPQDSSVLDLLKLSGGPTRDADMERVALMREDEEPLEIDLLKVLREVELDLLPPLRSGDTLFVPRLRERRSILRSIVRIALDLSTIATAILLIERRTND